MNKSDIDPETKQLLMLAGEGVLTRTIWGLSADQKNTPLFREIGQQRYLSALRVGAINEAEMTRVAFKADQFFAKSKLAIEAAKQGFHLQIGKGAFAVASKIKTIMLLGDDCVVPALPAEVPPANIPA